MKILFVGNRNLKHCGARYYDSGTKIINGLIREGHNVYVMCDRDIARNHKILGIKSFGVKYCNEFFLKTCINFKPDMVLFHHADLITIETIKEAKSVLTHAKFAQFNVDIIFSPHNIENIKSKLPYLDASFHTTAGKALKVFSGYRAIISYIPNPVDSSIDTPKCHESSNQEYDIFWAMRVGKRTFKGDKRLEYPLFLEKNESVKIDYYGMNGRPLLFNAEYYQKISNCKMGLNISSNKTLDDSEVAKPEDLYLYSSDRISQYMGSGLLTFASRENSLHELFIEDKEIVFFDSKYELLDKIMYYKKNDSERKKIAAAGWQKSHTHFNERIISKYMVETTMQKKYSENYLWPIDKY